MFAGDIHGPQKAGSVFGAPASDAIALGIIGCGGRGNAVGKDLMNAGARIVALHDLFDDRLAETKDRFDELAAVKKSQQMKSPTTMVLQELPKPRQTTIHR